MARRLTRATPEMEKLQATLDSIVLSNAAIVKSNEDIKNSNKLIQAKVDKIDAIALQLDGLNTTVNNVALRVDKVESDFHQQAATILLQAAVIQELRSDLNEAMDGLHRQEVRQRDRNLRIQFIPEKAESGVKMEPFIAGLLSESLGVLIRPKDIEVAHRIGPPPVGPTSKPRTVILRMHRPEKKKEIFDALKQFKVEKRFPLFDKQPIRITMDPSNRVKKMRESLWPLRDQLHKKNLRTAVRDSGVLLVWLEGQRDPEEFVDLASAITSMTEIYPDIKVQPAKSK